MNPAATVPPVAAGSARPAPPMRERAFSGAFWTILFSVCNKAAAFGGQLALAWFLSPEDFGLVAMAFSITSVASLVSGTNLKNLLIQRQDRFEADAGQIFWLSLTMNVASGLILAALSPLAGRLFRETRVAPVILVVAFALPIMALPTVYAAALYRDLRFRVVAQIQFCEGLIRNGLAVALAMVGFGAYSLVLPLVASSIFAAVGCRLIVGEIPLGRPCPRLWPALLAPAGWLMAIAFVSAVQAYGVSFVIGLTHNPSVNGFYYWGFAFSSQAIFLLATNLQGVFFPVLSKLNHDSKLQQRAFRQLCQVLSFAIVPVCVLQIVLARPLIELLFHERWLRSVPVVQWLSVAMLTQPLSIVANALLLARGKYRLLACFTGFVAFAVTSAAVVGARLGEETEIARCTSIVLFLTNLLAGWIASREFQPSGASFLRVLALPLAVVAPSALLAWSAVQATKNCPRLVSIVATSVALLVAHGAALRWLAPELVSQLKIKFYRALENYASASLMPNPFSRKG